MSSALLALSILSASFLGSWHCAGMCGPMASLAASRQGLWAYHLGRLCSYVFLGALSGALGAFFLNSDFVLLRWISAWIFAGFLFYSGLRLYRPSLPALSVKSPLARFYKMRGSSFLMGLSTLFLPCGWLYTYIAASIATRSPYAGALMMFLFWAGTVPALSALPQLVRKTMQRASRSQQKTAGVILIGASLYSLGSFMFL